MRKLKGKKKEVDLLQKMEEMYQDSIKELERLLDDPVAFKTFMYFFQKEETEAAIETSNVLKKLLANSFTKNRTLKLQRDLMIKNEALNLVKKFSKQLRPTRNLLVFTALFELNELLCSYTQYPNRFLKALESTDKGQGSPEFKEMLANATGTLIIKDIEDYLGYEPVFSGDIQRKFLDVLNWLPKSIVRLIKYNPDFFIPSELEQVMEHSYVLTGDIVKQHFVFSQEILDSFGKDCELFYSMVTRMAVASSSLNELEKINKDISSKYKDDIRHLKCTITRLKNIFSILFQLIEYGEYEEDNQWKR